MVKCSCAPTPSTEWLKDNGEPENFEQLPEEQIDGYLSRFYSEVRSAQGDVLSHSTLNGIRAGIGRHLQNPPFKRQIIITKSEKFAPSNRILKSVWNNNKKSGQDKTTKRPFIEEEDLSKLKFNIMDPKNLQEKVFMDLQFHFGRRGREGLRSLTKKSFILGIDHNQHGLEFVEMAFNEFTKNHRASGEAAARPRMYATNEDDCPINSFKMYMAHLDNTCDTFYTMAKTGKTFDPSKNNTWYTTKPLGQNTLGNLTKNISKRLGLSKNYTNHSIRHTVIKLLDTHGCEARHIMNVTGQKSEKTIQRYQHDNSVSKKREVSSILSKRSFNDARSTATTSTTQHPSATTATTTTTTTASSSSSSTITASQTTIHQRTTMNFEEEIKERFTITGNHGCTFNFHFHSK